MSVDSININIDLRVYEARLRKEISSDLIALKYFLETISNPQKVESKFLLKQDITLVEISAPPIDFQKQREINKCFKSIIGSLQDYIDNLLALLLLRNEKLTFPTSATSKELNELVEGLLAKKLMELSTNRKLNVPKKINLIFDKPEHQIYKESIQSYFEIRNGLEHHKGLAKSDRVLKYKRMGVASSIGHEITLPMTDLVEGGVVMKSFDEEIKFDQGGELILSKKQLDELIISLLIFVIPQIQQSVAEKILNVSIIPKIK